MAKGNEILLELKAENKQLKAQLKDAQKRIDGLETRIKKAAAGANSAFRRIGSAIGTYLGFRTVQYFSNLAGEVSSVTDSFYNLAAGAEGGAEGLLKALQKASKGTVDNLSIMRSSNLAFQLMGDQVAEQLPKMMEIAMAAAKAQGKKTADLFNDIVVATGRRSIMILDNLGISSATAAKYQEEFAKKLGKTRDQLNETEKSQAFFYATMKAGGEIVKRVGSDALSYGQRMQQLEASVKNTAQQISLDLIPAFESLGIAFGDSEQEAFGFLRTLGKIAGTVVILVSLVVAGYRKLVNSLRMLGNQISVEIQNSIAYMLNNLAKSFMRLGTFGKNAARRLMDYAQTMRNGATESANALVKNAEKLDKTHGDIDKIIKKFDELWDDSIKKRNKSNNKFLKNNRHVTDQLKKQAKERGQAFKEAEYLEYVNERVEAELAKEEAKYSKMLSMEQNFNKRLLQQRALIAQLEQISQFGKDEQQKERAEQQLILEQERYSRLLQMREDFEKRLTTLQESYEKRGIIAQAKGAEARRKADWEYHKAKIKLHFAEFEVLKQMTGYSTTLMQSRNKTLFKLGKGLAYAQAVMNTAEAVTKIWGQWGWPLGAVFAGIATAALGVQLANIKRQKMPSYEKGRIPVLENGRVPQDHFPAFIGQDEFVMNGRTSRANYGLLKYMNENPGQAVGGMGGTTNNYYFTGNVMDEDYIRNTVIPTLEDEARYQNKEVFSEKELG